MLVINQIRRMLLAQTALSLDPQCVIDSVPIPVGQFHLAPSVRGGWPTYGPDFDKIPAKKETIFGYKLHLLVTLGGLILDFELTPASVPDLTIGSELLAQHSHRVVIGDKAYISAEIAADLWQHNCIRLHTLPRRNQKRQLPKPVRRLFNSLRHIIETVNAKMFAQFHIETNHAQFFWGLSARLYTKLTATRYASISTASSAYKTT